MWCSSWGKTPTKLTTHFEEKRTNWHAPKIIKQCWGELKTEKSKKFPTSVYSFYECTREEN